nr:transcription-repair coupling factor [Bacteroidota bacterium]
MFELFQNATAEHIHLSGLKGSEPSFMAASLVNSHKGTQVFVLPDKENAAYFHNDLEAIFGEREMEYAKRKILFFPTSYKKPYEIENTDSTNILLRTEVLNKIRGKNRQFAVVTYPEALAEKVVNKYTVAQNTLGVRKGDELSQDFLIDFLMEYHFERVDFVTEPGDFAVRGGIIDVFSFSNDYPYRIEFLGNEIESIRTFDPGSQLSLTMLQHINLIPDLQKRQIISDKVSFASFLSEKTIFWIQDLSFLIERMNLEFEKFIQTYSGSETENEKIIPEHIFIPGDHFLRELLDFSTVEFGTNFMLGPTFQYEFDSLPQPSFNKNFDLLINDLNENTSSGITNLIFSGNPKQTERLHNILDDIHRKDGKRNQLNYHTLNLTIHEGFINRQLNLACYTDHQIFDRYHRFHLREGIKGKAALTLKEIYDLKPGDYVTHIDHGIGKFDGLETIDNNGKFQEAIRLVYKNGDLLYVSIHSLHRIAKYIGSEGTPPGLNKLGTNNWNRLKERTKKKVKDIAKDLIKLYAERRGSKGFSFTPDTYLQHELEASFIYEDTPDQYKATIDVKTDLEKDYPMDRLVCGDVGFGKTEVAIRAAFKAVTDSKQAAVLVPTTILALQHYKTFQGRLRDFPVNIEYINRFKTRKEQTRLIKELADGKLDILIGTHRLIGKDIKFKDLGLLIIDEEQKFGVSVKEKLKQIKVNVDTLTLTATPIPRTLQFSLMGARDLSIINTPPPNRIPIQTQVRGFNTDVIRDAINYEVSRNGQVFFIHNRVKNINDVADMIQKFCPKVKIAIGHGQMEGPKLEKVMLGFIEGDYDVLVATTIVENGLDIPNANTIIVNDAQNFGLSDLHQLRGRVGRANRQAFCYLLSPPLSTLTPEARKRLRAIEEFSNLGSGFNIAMRDLDIRGAGNLLGAEQSGFISDIGYEMYNKILDEAMMELREEGYKELFKDQVEMNYVKDCQIETDLEIRIPVEYISITTERISLYKELDSIETEDDLLKFEQRLTDRFGSVPAPVTSLLNTLRMRWLAKNIGLEKILLKNNRLIGFFVSNPDSEYYNSDAFGAVINFYKNNSKTCKLRETNGKNSILFEKVGNVKEAIRRLKPIEAGRNSLHDEES